VCANAPTRVRNERRAGARANKLMVCDRVSDQSAPGIKVSSAIGEAWAEGCIRASMGGQSVLSSPWIIAPRPLFGAAVPAGAVPACDSMRVLRLQSDDSAESSC
jgi:hypothetical protein